MILGKRLLAGLTIGLLCHSVHAEEIAIEPQQIENLGITLASPRAVANVATTSATARVVIPPANVFVMATPQTGLIVRLDAAVGDDVEAGQVLAEIESPDFLTLQRDFLDAVNEERLARSQLERDRQLLDEGIIAGRRLQETETRARVSAARLSEQRQLLRIGGLGADDIRNLERDQKLSATLTIRAPANGVVLDLMAVTGERAEAMTPIYRLADLSLLWLELDVTQEQVGAITPGMKVARSATPDHPIAEVMMVGRAIERDTQSVKVRATFIDPAHGLKPGQFISAQILAKCCTDSGNETWAVPTAAVARSGTASYLFVRTARGFEVRTVRIVSADAVSTYVDQGVEAGDRIAVNGVAALKAFRASLEDGGE
jgi:cobalt-zinc-cadmium efflux system membrane fusion protein